MAQDKDREHLFRELISVEELLGKLDPRVHLDFISIEKPLRILPDKIVFAVGDQPHYIYIHRRGRAVLFQNEGNDRIIYACPTGPSFIYGLVESLSGNAFEMGIRTLTECEFDVIDRDDTISFFQNRLAPCFRLTEILSRLYQHALQSINSH